MAYFYIYIRDLYLKDPNFDRELLDLYQEFMNNLNIMAFIISDKACIKAVHGGIPRPDNKDHFDYITNHKQFTDQSLDPLEFKIRDCVLWSDPSIQHNQPTLETKRFKFYENQLLNFQNTWALTHWSGATRPWRRVISNFLTIEFILFFHQGKFLKG